MLLGAWMCYYVVLVENEIIVSILAAKEPYHMAMWFVVPLIVIDTSVLRGTY